MEKAFHAKPQRHLPKVHRGDQTASFFLSSLRRSAAASFSSRRRRSASWPRLLWRSCTRQPPRPPRRPVHAHPLVSTAQPATAARPSVHVNYEWAGTPPQPSPIPSPSPKFHSKMVAAPWRRP